MGCIILAKTISILKHFFSKETFIIPFNGKIVFIITSLVLKKAYVNCCPTNFERVPSTNEKFSNEQWRMPYLYVTCYYDFLITDL